MLPHLVVPLGTGSPTEIEKPCDPFDERDEAELQVRRSQELNLLGPNGNVV